VFPEQVAAHVDHKSTTVDETSCLLIKPEGRVFSKQVATPFPKQPAALTSTATAAPTALTHIIGGGDIVSTAALRGEIAAAEDVLEQFTALIAQIATWAAQLPERYAAAPFGTEALTVAVTHVTDANGDAEQIKDALTEMLAAIDEADSLGETVTGIEADGRIDAFRNVG
jgi:hypothetical protein